jgi:hypothetical protein
LQRSAVLAAGALRAEILFGPALPLRRSVLAAHRTRRSHVGRLLAPLLASASLLVVGSHLMSPAKSLVDKVTSFLIDIALLPLASSSPQRAESTSGRLPSPLPLAWLAALGITSFLLEGSLPVDQMRGQDHRQRSSLPDVAARLPCMAAVSRKNARQKISPRLIFV